MMYSASNWYNPDSDVIIEHPVLLLRGLWLFGTSGVIIVFLYIIYDKIGWGQEI